MIILVMNLYFLRCLEKLLEEGLPDLLNEALGTHSEGDQSVLLSLSICATCRSRMRKKIFFYLFKHLNCVHCQRWWRRLCTLWLCKSSTKASLAGVQESRWLGVLALCLSPRGSWRSLYKPPTEKGNAHLHGRVVIHVCWSYKQTCDTYRFKITVLFLPSQAKKTLQQLWIGCP